MPDSEEAETPAEAPDRFETIAYVYSQPELAVLLSLFGWEDIFILPINRHTISVAPSLAIALGGVQLRVHPADADRARALLATIDQSRAFWGPVFFRDRLADAILILALFLLGLAPIARIPAEFILERPAALRREA